MDTENGALRFSQAHARYRLIRTVSFQEATAAGTQAGLSPRARMTDITSQALAAWRLSWTGHHWTGEGGFPWDMISRRYRQKPRAFHAAVWHSSTLCGLAAGWVSAGRENVTLHYMESAPDTFHPLRGEITYLVFTAAEFYARALGVRRLVLRNPLPGVRDRYRSFGFSLALEERGNVYYYKEIT